MANVIFVLVFRVHELMILMLRGMPSRGNANSFNMSVLNPERFTTCPTDKKTSVVNAQWVSLGFADNGVRGQLGVKG